MRNMWARIENDRVAEITDIDPLGRFHPSIEWVECNVAVEVGHYYSDGKFSKPTSEPQPVLYPRFTTLEMLDLFTEEEQLAVVTATLTSPPIKLWYDRLIAATYVTYEDPRTEEGLQTLVDAELITADRKKDIETAMQSVGDAA